MVQATEVTDPKLLDELNSSGRSQEITDPNLLSQLEDQDSNQGIIPSLLAGGAQGLAKVGHGIGDLETRVFNSIFGTQLNAPNPQLIQALGMRDNTSTKVGDVLGQIVGGGALAAALPGSLPVVFGATEALTTPGGAKERAIAGATGTAVGGAVAGVGKLAPYLMKYVSNKSLAKAVENFNDASSQQSKNLYKSAFEGTESLKPHISTNTVDLINGLKGRPGTLDIFDRVNAFERKPTVENIHRIRSEVGKKVRKLNGMKELGGRDQDTLSMLSKLYPELDANLEKSFAQSGSQKYNQWRNAQSHYAQNRAPLNKYKSIRDLLSDERTISPRLKTDLLKDERTAQALREKLGVKSGLLSAGKVHGKLLDVKTLGVLEALKHLL